MITHKATIDYRNIIFTFWHILNALLQFSQYRVEISQRSCKGLYWRGPVGPLEDGLEGALEVVLQRADELLLVQRHDTRHPQQQQHQGLQLTSISLSLCQFVIFTK